VDLSNSAPLGIALLGLLLGMRHATDPDHVIAVTAILSRERRLAVATRIGIVWGLGHSATVLAVGAAIIVFKLEIPARLGLAMEFAVALVLIALGLGGVGRLLGAIASRLMPSAMPRKDGNVVVHSHAHAHGGARHRHVHAHYHAAPNEDGEGGSSGRHGVGESHNDHLLAGASQGRVSASRPLMRSFGVGLVHGLAGSAAIALLVLSAIPRPLWATLYLAVFCVGTVVGMGLITTAIATPLILASKRMSTLHQRLVAGSGLLSFGFGLFLAYRIGIVDRLFASGPIWMPH
jgi:high-affinity nickel-transport protein